MAPRKTIIERVVPGTVRSALETHHDAVVLLDPNKLSGDALSEVFDAVIERAARVVLYARLSQGTVAVVLRETAHFPFAALVLAYEYNEAEWLHEQLKFDRPEGVLPLLLGALRSPLSKLPARARMGAVGMFGQQHSSHSDFLARVDVPARSVRRWFHSAGLHGPARFARGVRLARAIDRCWFGDEDLENVAELSGIGSAATLRGISAAVVGVEIFQIGYELTPSDVARRIANDICIGETKRGLDREP